ncbi:MAG: SRPBCC family protein [Rhodocyclaceae bacterium]|nr:SRPBCC family protein [Rhodocyclaceae bacterium]
MSGFEESLAIAAPADRVWAALADIGAIARWNPGVVASRRLTAGAVGSGARRRCELGGGAYLEEEVARFEPGREISFRITATNLPLASAEIRFRIETRGDGCMVTVAPAYRVRYGVLGRLAEPLLVRPVYRRGMRRLLEGLKVHLEGRTGP